MEAENALTAIPEISGTISVENVWTNKEQFDQIARSAKMLSQVQIIPQAYQGKPADCFVAIEIASRMNVSPLMVMQNMYVVKGKPSWSGQACTALISGCGKFRDVTHVYTGQKGTDDRGCYVRAIRVSDDEAVLGTEVTIAMAKAEGWTSNSKWRNMPELMLAYRASAFFARVYCPEALMGLQTSEEIQDVYSSKNQASELTAALKGEDNADNNM